MALSVNNLNPSVIRASSMGTGAMPPWGLLGLSKRSVEVEEIGESSCNYQNIVAKYPGMDSASQLMVKNLCENVLKTLDPGSTYLSDQGIHGIRDALQQNTNLQSFTIGPVCMDSNEDCLSTFALDMVAALQVNRGLKTLILDNREAPVLATQELFTNLPCFNLDTFIYAGQVTPTVAQAVFPKIFSQKFPLANFRLNINFMSGDALDWIVSPLAQGIGSNSCLKTLNLADNSSSNATTITTIFEAIGISRIQRFDLPSFRHPPAPYTFSKEQTAAILESVRSNPCFLECVPADFSPLPVDLVEAMNNITKTRTPCQPDPECNVPVACSSPTPTSGWSLSVWEGGIIGGVTGTIVTALTALGIYAARNCARSEESQPLLTQQNIQQV